MRAMYVVREGKAHGEGRYLRASGCMCFACIRWVDDRDDASRYVSKRPWPKLLAEREGARVVKLRASLSSGADRGSK